MPNIIIHNYNNILTFNYVFIQNIKEKGDLRV